MVAKENNTSSKRKSTGGGGKSGSSSKKQKKDSDKSKTTRSATENLSNSAQKRQVRKERQSHRRHADIVNEAKILWNKLRVKTNTPEETQELMDKLMSLITGKVNEIALQHDASRIVQAAIQFGSKEQRKELLQEICASQKQDSKDDNGGIVGGLAELAKIQYAHFCCLKFIKYCSDDDECVKMIVKVRDRDRERRIEVESPRLSIIFV
jgi:pumilio family protein 6